MKSNEKLSTYITSLITNLSEEQLDQIDFDHLTDQLESINQQLQTIDKLQSELELFRTDYLKRLSGMIKAIAAIQANSQKIKEAAEYIETLKTCSASQLIKLYRSVQSKFRDMFPLSFDTRIPIRGESAKKDYSQYQ